MKPLHLGMLLLSTSRRCSLRIIHDRPIHNRNARPGLHQISRCLDTVWYTRERTPARIAFSIMLVQRDTELIRAIEHHMQELILPWKQAVTAMCIKLCMEVLVWVCGKEADKTRPMLDGQVLAGAVPESQVVVYGVLKGVDDQGRYVLRVLCGTELTPVMMLIRSVIEAHYCWED